MPRISALIDGTRAIGGTVAPCTLELPVWIELLALDSDAEFLIEGFAYGFELKYVPPVCEFYVVGNYVPVELAGRVTAQIAHERTMGRIVAAVRGIVGISAMGAVLKGMGPKVRVVHDYARPTGCSVNSGIVLRRERFARVSDAASMLRPDAYHCKVDITEAYRNFPMAPVWWTRHVFEWGGVVYSDLRMPFGNSGAPSAFHRFSMAFTRLIQSRGFPGIISYLDDFWLTA